MVLLTYNLSFNGLSSFTWENSGKIIQHTAQSGPERKQRRPNQHCWNPTVNPNPGEPDPVARTGSGRQAGVSGSAFLTSSQCCRPKDGASDSKRLNFMLVQGCMNILECVLGSTDMAEHTGHMCSKHMCDKCVCIIRMYSEEKHGPDSEHIIASKIHHGPRYQTP